MLFKLFRRYRARRSYVAAGNEAAKVWEWFTASDGTEESRWAALLQMANCERTIAESAFRFGNADERDEDGFTVAQSHSMAADLLELVAATELPDVSHSDQPADLRHEVAVGATARTGWDHDPAVVAVLTQLAAAAGPRARAELMVALFNAVVGRVGRHAAEVLRWVAHGYYVLAGLSIAEADVQWHADRERSIGGGQP